ncbi:MAG TPA: NAD(P) transhydrogenase subunit alpha [Candidatus Limnocylindrales bacterium]|nr:NAD(P) transhydrogenase subunit alpha [Candidatus Limnocylindrales bacterium]
MNQILFQPIAFIAAFYITAGGESSAEKLAFNPAVLIASLYVFALAAFLGYQVISRVPPLLHTPLMSATNAISGISVIGSLVIAGSKYDQHQTLASLLGCAAVTSAMINVTGGFLITDRMLKMFRKKDAVKPEAHK